MQVLLVYWLLGALVLLQQHGGEALTSCKLHFEGFGNKQGLKTAHLACTGGSIQASAHPSLLGFTRSFSGVEWSDAGDCGTWKNHCVLTLCGNSSVHFPSAMVRQVNISTFPMLLCMVGNSNVSFDRGQFQGNTARPITTVSPGVQLRIKGSTFTNNSLPWDLYGGALTVAGGSALVEASTFSGNSMMYKGGAISVTNSASLQLVASNITANTGGSRLKLAGQHEQFHVINVAYHCCPTTLPPRLGLSAALRLYDAVWVEWFTALQVLDCAAAQLTSLFAQQLSA
jgi:hypothetical protein